MTKLWSGAAQCAAVLTAAMAVTGPAIAGVTVPGPVLGAGAPALLAIAGGYYLIRRYRRR